MSEPTGAALTILHNEAAHRFEVTVEGLLSICDYVRHGTTVSLNHTVVPPALGGRGIATALVARALAWARAEGLRVDPACSYVAAYMKRHPETQDLLQTR